MCSRVKEILGADSICPSWFDLRDFHRPAMLAAAVSKARRSDVIVIAVRAMPQLPLALCYWAERWLPYRSGEWGALVALIDVPETRSPAALAARRFFHALSLRAGLDFMLKERQLPAQDPSPLRDYEAAAA